MVIMSCGYVQEDVTIHRASNIVISLTRCLKSQISNVNIYYQDAWFKKKKNVDSQSACIL